MSGRSLVEALEDGFQLIFWNTDAAVLDADVGMVVGVGAVSYTHLDVYKRQAQWQADGCTSR